MRGRMRQMSARPLVVQKFGGSSLADADRIRRVARRIARERATGADLVVVVSAMGDTTDELLCLAAAITDEPDERELDMLLATGEHQSATLVSMALHALGVPAISPHRRAGRHHDRQPPRPGPHRQHRPARIRRELDAGKVVIVAGFQGRTEGDDVHASDITTLGRGGSDTTAVALAARLGADRCQIFTDVRGIYTADPRLVPDARQLDVIGYEEMLELAHQGAQVMQTRAVELGWVNDVVIEVLSSFEDAPGTLIKEDPFVEQRNKVRGLAHDRNVAKVTLVEVPGPAGRGGTDLPAARRGRHQRRHDRPERQPWRHHGHELHGHAGRAGEGEADPRPVARELGLREITTDASVAKVSIVGAGIQNAPGYAARMFARPRRRRREHRDDLDQRDPDHAHHRRGQRRARPPRAARGVRARAARTIERRAAAGAADRCA